MNSLNFVRLFSNFIYEYRIHCDRVGGGVKLYPQKTNYENIFLKWIRRRFLDKDVDEDVSPVGECLSPVDEFLDEDAFYADEFF